ncbi:hypothetical protein I5F77_24480, partial [Pseudomonas aeruginosa]|nr:hypothetical protein [Pseudomonas aeruginosa]
MTSAAVETTPLTCDVLVVGSGAPRRAAAGPAPRASRRPRRGGGRSTMAAMASAMASCSAWACRPWLYMASAMRAE